MSAGKAAWAAGLSALALVAGACGAVAQGVGGGAAVEGGPGAAGDIEGIVVTARRIEERLQDVPIAVSTLTAEDLGRQNVDDLGDLADKTVGFTFESLSGAITQPSIRGQANLRVDNPVTNVAFYLDGLYLQRGYLVDQSLLELERVEVIKGPQSALYGRNAFAGAVNIVTRRPSLTNYSAKVSGTIGSDERYDWRAAVSFPVIRDRLALFFNYAHSEFDGTWENSHPLANAAGALTRGNTGGWNKDTYQGRVVFRPIDSVTLDVEYIRTDRLIEATPGYAMSTRNLTNAVNTLNCSLIAGQNRLFCGQIPASVVLAPGETRVPGLITDPRAFGLNGPTDIVTGTIAFAPDGPITATYQFGLTKARITARGSPTRDPLTPSIIFGVNYGTIFDSSGTDSSFEGYSHEVRFDYANDGPVRFLIGANYSSTKDLASNASEFAPTNTLILPNPNQRFPIGPGLPFPSGFFQRSTFQERAEEVMSGFAFVGITFSPKLEASIEGRYTGERIKLIDFLTRDQANPALQSANPFRSKRSTDYFTPRASITYKFSTDNNVYASVARGVKSGGLNGNVPFPAQRSFDDETNWTYEIGSKNQFFDRRLQLNVAAFYTDWANLQTSGVRLAANGGVPNLLAIVPSTTVNIGGVNVYGIEAEGRFKIAPPLSFEFGASWNQSRYQGFSVSQRFGASGNCDGIICTSVPGTPTRVLPVGGNSLERVPEFDGRAALVFDTQFQNGWDFYTRVDVTYQTKSFTDESNLAWAPARTLVGGSAGVTVGPVVVQAWVKNLLDEKYVSNAFVLIGTSGFQTAAINPNLGERRTFGLTATASFGGVR